MNAPNLTKAHLNAQKLSPSLYPVCMLLFAQLFQNQILLFLKRLAAMVGAQVYLIRCFSIFWNKVLDFWGFVVIFTYYILGIPFVRAISYIYLNSYVIQAEQKEIFTVYSCFKQQSYLDSGKQKHLKHSEPIKIHVLLSS